MNWVDITILVILAVAATMGMNVGLIRAAFGAVGAFVGWLVASQYADEIGSTLSYSLASDTIVTVVFYVVIILLGLIISGIAAKIVNPFLTVLTMGLTALVDKGGGIVVGTIMGCLISGALILGTARLAYNFEVPEPAEGVGGEVASRLPEIDDVRQRVDDSLTSSAFVPVFIMVAQKVPGDTLGLVPEDFRAALEILDERIDKKDAAE